jgi:hypothetical protein
MCSLDSPVLDRSVASSRDPHLSCSRRWPTLIPALPLNTLWRFQEIPELTWVDAQIVAGGVEGLSHF